MLALWAGLAGCASAANPVDPAHRAIIELPRAPSDLIAFRLPGPPSPTTLAVRLRLPPRLLAKTAAADLESLKLALVVQPLGVSPAGAADLTPVGSLFSYDTRAATGSVEFGNVPANAAGDAYYVVVAGFDATAGAGANITNTTGSDAAAGRVRLAGIDGPFYVSGGSVRVAPFTYALSTTVAFEVGLKLLD